VGNLKSAFMPDFLEEAHAINDLRRYMYDPNKHVLLSSETHKTSSARKKLKIGMLFFLPRRIQKKKVSRKKAFASFY
jgi:hypothetical protein